MSARHDVPNPPTLAERILTRLVGSGARGRTILGDAREEMTARWSRGQRLRAAVWYWFYVARFAVTYGGGVSARTPSGLGLRTAVRQSARSLIRRPGFSTTVILTLGLGIGAATVAFALVDGALLRPLPYDAPQELVLVSRLNPKWFGGSVTPAIAGAVSATPSATFFDWKRRSRVFTALGAYQYSMGLSLQDGGEPVRITANRVTSGVFAALGVPAQVGRHLLEEDDAVGAAPVAVLSHGLWMRRFGGDPGIVGRSIRIDGHSFAVVGVMPSDFEFPSPSTDVWLPFGDGILLREARNGGDLRAIGRMAHGVDLDGAREDMRSVTRQLAALYEDERDSQVFVFPLKEVMVARASSGLLLLLGAALVMLLVGCVNVTNLFLGRSVERRPEFALHAALGAGSRRLAGLVLGESLLLASVGGLLGGVLAQLALRPFLAALPMAIPRAGEIAIDGRVVLAIALLTAGLALAVALVPALRTSRTDLNAVLRTGGQGGGGGRRSLRSHGFLVVAEVAMAVLLLSTSGLFVESHRLSSTRPRGFDARDVFASHLSPPELSGADAEERRAFFDNLLERTEAIPGVTDAAVVSEMPLTDDYSTPPVSVETDEGVEDAAIHTSVVSTDYFAVLDIPVLAGRGFRPSDAAGTVPVIVVSKAMAERYWPGQDPIGKRIRLNSGEGAPWREVVGMVDNIRYGFASGEVAEFYRPFAQDPYPFAWVVLKTRAGVAGVAEAARVAIREVVPTVPVSVVSLEAMALSEQDYRWSRMAALLLTGLAGTAVLLAVLGIYGVLSYAVVRRTRDIGIRVSLGGTRGSILRSVLGRFLTLAGVGIVLGLGLSVASGSLARTALVGAMPAGHWILAGVSAVVLATVTVASLVPAIRVLRVDPLVAFKAD